MPTELTASYTPLHHALICGDALASATFYLRQTLVNRLVRAVECRNVAPDSKLYDIAVDRVLCSYSEGDSIDPDGAFDRALAYLHRMIGVKKQVAFMIEERLPYGTWILFASFWTYGRRRWQVC